MRENRALVLGWIGLSEGGYVNHPRDPGGATDRGITQATYDAWNRSRKRPVKPVRGISKAEADDIIAFQYMDTVRFDELPAGLDYAMADYAVNSGPARAVRELQQIVGAEPDGVIGVRTLAALRRFDAEQLVTTLCLRRMAFLRRLSTFDAFGKGWTVRVMGKRDGVQTDDIGVVDRAVRLARGHEGVPPPRPVGTGKATETQPPSGGFFMALAALIARLFGGVR